MIRSAVALAIVVLGAITASAQFGMARLTLDGFGPVRIGMTEAEAREAVSDLTIGTDRETDPACYFLNSPSDRSVSFMVERGRVARIDIDDPHHWTLSGVHIGTTEADAQAVYRGRLRVQPHKYDPTGHYLIPDPHVIGWKIRARPRNRWKTGDVHEGWREAGRRIRRTLSLDERTG